MHPNFHFSTVQVLWTLTFAAQLVLLVVLLGRDRIKRFPWFTLSILLMALRLLASRLLYGRMPTITLSAIFVTLADVTAVVAFLVVVEMARRAFAPVRRSILFATALVVVAVAGTALYFWALAGLETLTAGSTMATLQLMQLGAQKFDMLVDMLTIELGVLVVLFGRRYGSGWHSHNPAHRNRPLHCIHRSTGRTSCLAADHASRGSPLSSGIQRVLGLRDKLFNANAFSTSPRWSGGSPACGSTSPTPSPQRNPRRKTPPIPSTLAPKLEPKTRLKLKANP